MINWGPIPVGTVIPFPFAAFGADGQSLTLTGLAVTDIEVYKGVSMTQRASDAGYALMDTDGIDIDARTGIHGFSIDTGDNTDAGYYAVGSMCWVVVDAVTINGQTVRFVAGTFRLVAAESVAGVPEVDITHINGAAQTATLDTIKAETAAIVNDTDVIDDATSGLVKIATDVAAILVDTGTTLQAELDGIQADTEDIQTKIGTPAGASVSADVAAVKADTAAILIDTAEIGAAGAGLTALATQASVNTIDGIVDDILVDTAVIGAAGAGLTEAGGTGDHLTSVPWNANWDAEVESEVVDGLAAYDGPTYTELLNFVRVIVRKDSALATDLAAVLTAINADLASGSGSYTNTTDALEAIRDRGDAAWGTATGFSTHSAADVWAVATRLLTAGTNIVLAKGTGITGFNDLSAAQVNAEADTALADYDPPTRTEATADKDAILAILGTPAVDLGADIIALKAVADAILLDTAEIGLAGIGLSAIPWNALWDAEVQSEVADALGVYDAPTRAELTTDINSILAAIAALDAPPSAATIASTVLGSTIESGITLLQIQRGFGAMLLGKVSGAQTGTELFRAADDSKTRVTMTDDEFGNRTVVTLDLS